MLGGKKPFSLNIAHKMALNMEKPYMYLCADITEPHNFSYEDIKKLPL